MVHINTTAARSCQLDRIGYFVALESLPVGWDDLFSGNSLFNSKKFLAHLELTNPVSQRYFYYNSSSGHGTAGTLYLTNLSFRLGPLCLSSPVTVCGIPMIYGSQAGFAPEESISRAAEALNEGGWPGFQWIVGLKYRRGEITGWSWKRFLITVDFHVKWDDFGQYLASMRSDYRKQIVASLKKQESITFIKHKGDGFTDSDYKLFIDIHRKANDKSIPLSKEFFKQFPENHYYVKALWNNSVLGWALLVPDGDEIYLLYIGYDVSQNKKYDVYINLLLESIRFAIDNKFNCLKMGQTSELTKMRLGGMPSERYFLVRHTNHFINRVIKKTDIFNFRKHYPLLHVFKSQ